MNALEKTISENHLNEVSVMNWLQGRNLISDNCVTASDVFNAVAAADAVRRAWPDWKKLGFSS